MIILEYHHGWLNPKTIAKITKKYGLPQISIEKFRMKILKDINRKRVANIVCNSLRYA